MQAAREELEKQQDELKALVEEQQNNYTMEAEERAKLQEEIEARQREIEEMRESVTEREQQSKQLEEEMQEAKLRMEVGVTDSRSAYRNGIVYRCD